MKDNNKVKKTVKEKKYFEKIIDLYNDSKEELQNLKDIYNLAREESDEEIISDCLEKIKEIEKKIKKTEISCFLSGENDSLNIYLEIHAGAGGT